MRKIKDEQDFLASLDAGEKLVKQGWANKYITKMPLELTEKMKLDFGIQADVNIPEINPQQFNLKRNIRLRCHWIII